MTRQWPTSGTKTHFIPSPLLQQEIQSQKQNRECCDITNRTSDVKVRQLHVAAAHNNGGTHLARVSRNKVQSSQHRDTGSALEAASRHTSGSRVGVDQKVIGLDVLMNDVHFVQIHQAFDCLHKSQTKGASCERQTLFIYGQRERERDHVLLLEYHLLNEQHTSDAYAATQDSNCAMPSKNSYKFRAVPPGTNCKGVKEWRSQRVKERV